MDFFMEHSENKLDFTGEDDVYNANSFEFFEHNLDYFSSRYTRDDYVCIAEQLQINSDFCISSEMIENIELYEKSVQWRHKTVHPENSEYVIKEEKYLFLDSFIEKFRKIVTVLNELPAEMFSCVDLILYFNKSFYQYLPQKNFVFTWEKNGKKLIEKVSEQLSQTIEDDRIVAFPIFVPIRKMLFFGEYGYREAMIDYGRILAEIMHCSSDAKLIRRFENYEMNFLFRLDGVEKSILSIVSC